MMFLPGRPVRIAAMCLPLVAATPSLAQTCEANFTVEGVPMVTSMMYRSWQVFPKAQQKRALENVASAIAAEGFDGIRVDRNLGAISAVQETSGSGRPQTLRFVVRKSGAGSRVDAVFTVQPGQIAPEGATRTAICRVMRSAAE